MYINNIYQDKVLKYPLTKNEYDNINKVWDFMKIFRKKFIHLSYFRNYVINKMKEYTVEEFYLYESILNKMFWNLRWLLFPLWYEKTEEEYNNFVKNNYNNFTEIPDSLLLCKKEKYTDENLKNKLYNILTKDNYYRSRSKWNNISCEAVD